MSVAMIWLGRLLVVGIIGGGQLARMCAGPAAELGVTLAVLAEAPDASAALVTPLAPVGDHPEVRFVGHVLQHLDYLLASLRSSDLRHPWPLRCPLRRPANPDHMSRNEADPPTRNRNAMSHMSKS